MAGPSFRFLHTSGFRLEATLAGLAEVPDHLRDALMEAPFQAVEQVTEAAIREDVDFVLLSGDVADPAVAGPAALAFLQAQCEKLRVRKVPIYWAASKTDLSGDVLSRLQLPDNVHIFPSDRVERITHFRGHAPVATVQGRSWQDKRPLRAAEFLRENQEGFQIAVLYGRGDLDSPPRAGVHYWALGGSAEPLDVLVTKNQVIHSPGTPQGLSVRDLGPRGCTLINVDGEGEIRARRIETDVVRWHAEHLIADGGSSLRDLRQSIRLYVERLLVGLQRPLFVRWLLTGAGRFDTPLVRRKEREEIIDWLRSDYGHRSPAIWTLELAMEPPEKLLADWCDDDTILGDFLRTIRDDLNVNKTPLDLRPHLPPSALPVDLVEALTGGDAKVTDEVLREAAVLGFDLLRGEEALGRGKSHYAAHAETEGETA